MTLSETRSELVYFSELGSGPPLLLVHGLMMTGEMFEQPVIEHFAGRHRVIVPDLRGHGRSRGFRRRTRSRNSQLTWRIAGSQLVMIDEADHALIRIHTDKFLQVTDEFLEA